MKYNMNDIIVKKRDGQALSKSEIEAFVQGYTGGEIPDYQASALLMAIFFRHMNEEETYFLTEAMKNSGDVMDLSRIQGVKVDKHSTGGVGDTVTLIACPLAASCGVKVAKMSGRGLGFTGGTIDKLESIPGFSTDLNKEEFISQVNRIGIAVMEQTGEIAPADKKLYALRDVAGSVEEMSLIASSIMSKKLASGSDAIVIDVKCGSGAFMKNPEDARRLADTMYSIGKSAGKKMRLHISDMSEPLGYAIGNSLEVVEACETLKGRGPEDLSRLSLVAASSMVHLAGLASYDEAVVMTEEAMNNGKGLTKLRELIEAEGGDPSITDDYDKMPIAAFSQNLKAESTGFIRSIDTRKVGIASGHTGAGRAAKDDPIDYGAGILLTKKRADRVEKGENLATVYASSGERAIKAIEELREAFEIGEKPPEKIPLILDTIS